MIYTDQKEFKEKKEYVHAYSFILLKKPLETKRIIRLRVVCFRMFVINPYVLTM